MKDASFTLASKLMNCDELLLYICSYFAHVSVVGMCPRPRL